MDDKSKINEFINMMDGFFASGGGHVNVIENNSEDNSIAVQTYRSADCGAGNKACCEPTVHCGIDDTDTN